MEPDTVQLIVEVDGRVGDNQVMRSTGPTHGINLAVEKFVLDVTGPLKSQIFGFGHALLCQCRHGKVLAYTPAPQYIM